MTTAALRRAYELACVKEHMARRDAALSTGRAEGHEEGCGCRRCDRARAFRRARYGKLVNAVDAANAAEAKWRRASDLDAESN
jgi:hypothetical protein